MRAGARCSASTPTCVRSTSRRRSSTCRAAPTATSPRSSASSRRARSACARAATSSISGSSRPAGRPRSRRFVRCAQRARSCRLASRAKSGSPALPPHPIVNERADAPGSAPVAPAPTLAADRAARYVPRMLQQHLVDDPSGRAWEAEGTAAFVDVSGFTQLSEALARKGREGAEQITDVIGHVFEPMLAVAYDNGGSLLKFGGDALLLWFDGEGHARHAARATVLMRSVLADVGRIELPDA